MENNSICFAYYADGKFIGWYGDTSGTVSSTPKLYQNTPKQIDVVQKNVKRKLDVINSTSFNEQKDLVSGLESLSLLRFSSEDLLRGKNIELKIVKCPFYDGPNPDFNEEEYDNKVAAERQRMVNAGIFDIPAPSIERSRAIDEWYKENPRIKCDNWIYADYNKVREWAKEEPIIN